MNKATILKTLTLLLLMIVGCSENERVAQIATEAADRQAEQNHEMARLNREVAEGTRRLVEADAEARREFVEVHQDLQGERGELNQQWNVLEAERKEITQQRRTESMIVPVAQAIGLTLLAVIVVGFCWTLLFGLRRNDESDAQLVDMLVRDVVSDRPIFLPSRLERPAVEMGQSASGNELLPGDVETPQR